MTKPDKPVPAASLTREALIAAMQATASPKPIAVDVPGWGLLHVKQPTVEEVDAASDATDTDAGGKKRRFARGAARIICDEAGNRIFDPANEADVDLLAKQPWVMLQKVMAASDVKGLDDAGN